MQNWWQPLRTSDTTLTVVVGVAASASHSELVAAVTDLSHDLNRHRWVISSRAAELARARAQTVPSPDSGADSDSSSNSSWETVTEAD